MTLYYVDNTVIQHDNIRSILELFLISNGFLTKLIWVGVIALVAIAGTLLVHAASDDDKPLRMKHLVVERLGIVEPDGKRQSGGALSFDGYDQDQIVQLLGYREGGKGLSGWIVSDRPDKSMDYTIMAKYAAASSREEAEKIATAANYGGESRAFLGAILMKTV